MGSEKPLKSKSIWNELKKIQISKTYQHPEFSSPLVFQDGKHDSSQEPDLHQIDSCTVYHIPVQYNLVYVRYIRNLYSIIQYMYGISDTCTVQSNISTVYQIPVQYDLVYVRYIRNLCSIIQYMYGISDTCTV